jgi:transcriptional regulator with XRE-family HTH domain
LGWSQAELAKRASVALRTVQNFERAEKVPIPNNVAALRRAIEEAGIRVVFDKTGTAAGILRHGADADLPS